MGEMAVVRRQIENHRCFPQPPDRDLRVWRYFGVQRFAQAMKNRAIRFSRSDLLGDPCEGSRPKGDAVLYETARAEVIGRGDAKFFPTLRANWKYHDDRARTDMFISCWQMQDHDMMSMWERYCRPGGVGVAIQTTYAKLDASVPVSFANDRHVMLGMVTYGDYDAADFRSDPSNKYSTFMMKKIGYADEREVRLVVDMFRGEHLKGVDIPMNMRGLVERVVVSPYANPGLAAGLEKFCRGLGYTMPVLQSSLREVATVY